MMIQHPEALGDTYAELIKSLCRAPTVAARGALPRPPGRALATGLGHRGEALQVACPHHGRMRVAIKLDVVHPRHVE